MNTLLTGGSGLLGKKLWEYLDFYAPSSKGLDITEPETLSIAGDYKRVIHCAAYTNVPKAEIEKSKCFNINVTGTYNMAKAFPDAYFVYISTEHVGIPVNYYSHTKLWGEEMVKKHHQKYLIIRTLFKRNPFPYKYAFFDQHTQGDYIDVIAPLIAKEILKGTTGTVHLGTGRKTMFELARRTKPNIKANSIKDIKDVKMPHDYV